MLTAQQFSLVLSFWNITPAEGGMSVCVFPLVTSTVGATESLIMVGLREMREPHREEKVLWLTIISFPLVPQKTSGKLLMLLHEQNGKDFKDNFEGGWKKISSICSSSLSPYAAITLYIGYLKAFLTCAITGPQRDWKTHFTMWCWGCPWAPTPSSHSWALLNPHVH